MHKKIALIAFGLLLMLPFVAAQDTTITINTHPTTWVMVRAFQAGNNLNLLNSFLDTQVDETGNVTFILSSNETDLNLEVYVKLVKNGPAFIYKKYENIEAGKPFTATVMKGVATEVTTANENASNTESANETVTGATANENASNTESANETVPITGDAIIESGTSVLKNYYIWGAILAAGLIVGGLFFARQRMRNPTSSGPTQASSNQKVQSPEQQLSSDTLDSLRDELQATKAKLQQANNQMSKVQNKERVRDLEQHIKEEEAELLRLKKEEYDSP